LLERGELCDDLLLELLQQRGAACLDEGFHQGGESPHRVLVDAVRPLLLYRRVVEVGECGGRGGSDHPGDSWLRRCLRRGWPELRLALLEHGELLLEGLDLALELGVDLVEALAWDVGFAFRSGGCVGFRADCPALSLVLRGRCRGGPLRTVPGH